MIVTSSDAEDSRLTEDNHQQQEEEQKAVIDAFHTIKTHMGIPPYNWLIFSITICGKGNLVT